MSDVARFIIEDHSSCCLGHELDEVLTEWGEVQGDYCNSQGER